MRVIDHRSHHRALAGLLLSVVVLASPPARGQLPLPELGDGPDLRLASTDAFVDRLQSARQKISRALAARQPDIERRRIELERRLQRADQGGLLERFDPATARRLREALGDELALWQSALEVLRQATQITSSESAIPPRTATLDDVVAAYEQVLRYEEDLSHRLALAQQLQRLVDIDTSLIDATVALDRQLRRQRQQIYEAQSSLAQAEALEAEALARRGREQLGGIRAAWEADAESLADAESELDSAKRTSRKEQDRLQRLRARTATVARARTNRTAAEQEARQAQIDALLASIGHRQARAEARIIRAAARVATIRKRVGTPTTENDRLAAAALAVQMANADSAALRVERRLAALPETGANRRLRKIIAAERDALETGLLALKATRRDLRRALIFAKIRDARPEQKSVDRRSPELGLALTVVVLLAGVFLLARGYRWGHVLLESQRLLPAKFRLSERTRARLGTVAVLLWPVGVAAATAALLIWPVWGLSLTISEAIQLVDRPFFFVDETGVSLLSLVKLAFAIYAANVLSKALREFLVTRVYPQTEWDIGLTTALDTLVHYLTMSVGLIVGLRFVGVGFSVLAIFAGVLGIGIGFGLRNVTENFISGLIILAERPIKIGDFIQLSQGELEGQVRRIRARSTTVVTRDNISIIIPNSEFVSSRVTNWSHGDPKVRISVTVGVAYGSECDKVKSVLLAVSEQHEKVLSLPRPEVEFRQFGQSSLTFLLRVWIDQQVDRFRIASDLHFAIDAAFRENEIVIAFPQVDVHFKSPLLLHDTKPK